MNIVFLGIAVLAGLGLIVALGSWLTRKPGEEDVIHEAEGDCSTCSGSNTKCEQTCMMEAATREVEYFDDEELDRFRGRTPDSYADDEVAEFAEVLYTLRPEDVKPWNRSLVLRGINVPNALKDELFLMME